MRIVEHAQLSRLQALDAALGPQHPPYRVGQPLARVHEATGKRPPLRAVVRVHAVQEQHRQTLGLHRHQRHVHRHRWSRVLV